MLLEEFKEGSDWKILFSLWYLLVKWVVPVAIFLILLQKSGFINLDKLLANK